MASEGYQVLADLGDQAAAAGNNQAALDFYAKSLRIKGDNPEVIFNQAMVYKNMNDTDTANQLFGEVIMNYSDSDLAESCLLYTSRCV